MRPAIHLVIILQLAIALGCAHHPSDAHSLATFRGYRVAAWVFDPPTHQPLGFAEGTINPAHDLQLEPAKGHVMTFTAAGLGKSTVYDSLSGLAGFGRQESSVDMEMRFGKRGDQWSADLYSPVFQTIYGLHVDMDSITLVVPVGSLQSPRLAAAMPATFRGDTGELEDLLLAAVQDGSVEAGRVAQVYARLGRSLREERWVALMHGRDHDLAMVAAVALAQVGHAGGTARFCQLCRSTTGNTQTDLLQLIHTMPQSDAMLETSVALILGPRPYLTLTPPNVYASDVDRRYVLLNAVLAYPPAKLRPYGPRLIKWAEANNRKDVQERVDAILNTPA